jgi:ubiquinone/menaquinone biosynthesis C-methylase UbiE
MNRSSSKNDASGSQEVDITKVHIREFFNKLAKSRNETIDANPIIQYEQSLRAETALSLLAPTHGDYILEIGCGNARDTVTIVENGGEVVGIDVSEEMVDAAQRELAILGFPDTKILLEDATSLSFSASHFDKVLCSEVIEHIPDTLAALTEMRRVLKHQGKLVLTTPNRKGWYAFDRYVLWERILGRVWPHPFDQWRTAPEISALVEQAGFRILSCRTVCFVPGFLITYFILPAFIQRGLIKFIRYTAQFWQRLFPFRGYTICLVAEPIDHENGSEHALLSTY